jgi:hypothetical protein
METDFVLCEIGAEILYRVIQEERSIFWKVTVSVIVRKNYMNMCLIVTHPVYELDEWQSSNEFRDETDRQTDRRQAQVMRIHNTELVGRR